MDQLPSDIIRRIFSNIDHPYYWINTMSTCKYLRELIYPMYLIKDFRVISTNHDGSKKCDKMIYFATFLRLFLWKILGSLSPKPTKKTI